MGTLLQDLKYGVRMLAKNPGYAAVVVLCLALGIGANTAIFTLINAVMLKSLPVEKPDELVLFGEGRMAGTSVIDGIPSPGPWELVSYPLYKEYRDDNQVFQGVCAFQSNEARLNLRIGGTGAPEEPVFGKVVSGNYFSVLGVKAAAGRTLTSEDDALAGAHPVAVISYGYWQRRFSRDPSVVGSVIDISGIPFTIVGITAPGFFGETLESNPADIWAPITMESQVLLEPSRLDSRGNFWLHVIGRLKPGVTSQQAQAAVTTHFQQYLLQMAGSSVTSDDRRDLAGIRIDLTPGGKGVSQLRRRYSEPLKILMVLVGLVLLIACANVANLLLARATARQKEISLRCALGASRSRMIRQMLTESIVLAILGGLVGLLLAGWGTSLLVYLVSRGSYIPLSISPDARILGFTLLVSLLTGMLFGLAPAVRAARTDLSTTLKEGARSVVGHGTRFSLTKGLVIVQVALCLLMLVGGGLFVRTLQKLESQDLGFNRENVLLVGISPRMAGYKPEQLPSLYRQILERVGSIPGVKSTSLALYGLVSGSARRETISVQGYTPKPREETDAQMNIVGPGYIETAGMTLLAGRGIEVQDTETSAKVAVINEALAHYYFGNQNPVGKRLAIGEAKHAADFGVVGVVKDAKYTRLREASPPMLFIPVFQNPDYMNDLQVRTIGDPTSVAADVRKTLNDIDSKLNPRRVITLSQQVDDALSQERLVAQLSTAFGGLALLLACVGLYGVMAYAVTRRTNEIGIRMALGAGAGNVLWMVLRETLLLVGVGLAIGIPAALASTRLIASQLFDLSPYDPLTLSVSSLLLIAVAALAGFIPARRASRVDPMVALRYE
jgi:predicted permease